MLWRLSRVLSASLLAEVVALVEQWWAFGASGLFALGSRKRAVVRLGAAELRAVLRAKSSLGSEEVVFFGGCL